MRSLVATPRAGAPVALRDDAPEPQPAANEAVIAVRAVGVNRGELRLIADRDGWGPGQDVAGEVIRAAADGSGPARGTRVVALVDQGGWAERVAAPVDRLAALPAGVSFSQAASLPVAGLTALRALRVGGSILGRHVLVTGAGGGVGRFAVELAAEGGAAGVTAVVRDTGPRAAGLRDIGATEIVTAIAEATGGPFDLILESVGGASLTQAVRAVAADGTVAVFGNSSGEPSALAFGDFRGHPRSKVIAFGVYTSGDGFGADLAFLAELVAAGRLHPTIGIEVGWHDAVRAFAALRERQVNGKAVMRIEDPQ